jgi:hypothetical protein
MSLSRKQKRKPNTTHTRHKHIYAKWITHDNVELPYVFRNRSIETVERYLKITNAKEVLYIESKRPFDPDFPVNIEMLQSLIQYFYERYTEKGVLKTGSI